MKLRAERSGRGDGRVYTIAYTAKDPSGASCSGTVTVTVPHDKRGPAITAPGQAAPAQGTGTGTARVTATEAGRSTSSHPDARDLCPKRRARDDLDQQRTLGANDSDSDAV